MNGSTNIFSSKISDLKSYIKEKLLIIMTYYILWLPALEYEHP